MNLDQYSPEELRELSMIEVAYSILESKKQATSFQEMVQEIAATIGLSQEEVARRLSQFYTDLNIDGRFINVGENRLWGLRSWYPYEQIEEEVLPQPKAKKKRKVDDEDLDEFVAEDDFDDLEELEDDLEDLEDDIDDLDDDDDDLDDDLDELDEDLDEELDEDDIDDDLLDEEDKLEELDDDEDFVDEDEAEYDEVEEKDEL